MPDSIDEELANQFADAIYKMVRNSTLNFMPSTTENDKKVVAQSLLLLLEAREHPPQSP